MATQEFTLSSEQDREKAEDLFQKAIHQLTKRDPALAASLLMKQENIHYIAENQKVFAGAFYDPDEKESALLINSLPWSELSEEEATAVLAHEALHFYLDHHTWNCPDPELDRLYGYAADIVINDYLLKHSFVLPQGAVSGLKLFGINCAKHSIEKVFEILLSLSGYIQLSDERIKNILHCNDTPQSLDIRKASYVEEIC